MSEVKVNKISPRSGTDVTLGDSGDTFTVPTGVTLDTSNSTVTLPDGTVTNAKVNASAAIDYSKLNLTGNIALADLSATGTKDATTFLRGDNTFAAPSGGKILQVVSTHYTDKASSSSDTPADVSGFSADITPSSTSNKILVMVTVSFGGVAAAYPYILCQREISGGATTSIGLGTGASGAQVNVFLARRIESTTDFGTASKNFLDTPNTTSAITYQIQFAAPYNTSYINRQSDASNSDFIQFPSSSITLMEVAG